MNAKSHQNQGLIDALLFSGFVLACFLELTGTEAHQWLGMALGGLALYHLWQHRTWAQAATRRFVTGLASRARLYALLDLALFTGLDMIIFTGLIISSWLNLALDNYAAWHTWHVATTLTTLGLLVAKLGLHWRWIVQALRPPAPKPAAAMAAPMPPAATARSHAVSRRDFLQVMGVVSAAALLAGARVVGNQATVDAEPASPAANTTTSTTATSRGTTSAASTSRSAAATCQVRCNRRCAYPGHCRRYTDSNGNGRCDLGECSS